MCSAYVTEPQKLFESFDHSSAGVTTALIMCVCVCVCVCVSDTSGFEIYIKDIKQTHCDSVYVYLSLFHCVSAEPCVCIV